ncbi:MAG: 50S ribosomal protein L11 methyltransferase [Desulfosalsimonas sp.]
MSNPYNDLHIYYIKGRVRDRDAESRFDSSFLGNWQEEGVSFLFFDRPADEQVKDLIESDRRLELADRYNMSYADWHGGEIVPFSTDRFVVTPPWVDNPAQEGSFKLSVNPGVVFGAGTHTTTRFCLEAVEVACEKGAPDTAMDLGTGTGLLGLAAAALGCRKVLAVDSSFLAVRTARENIKQNGFDSRVLAVQADARQLVECPADLLIANIHFDVMRHLVVSPAFYEKKWFVLSGLLRSQARYVEEVFRYGPARLVQRWTEDGIWYTFLAATGG